MTREQARDLCSEYLEGQLSPDLLREFEALLAEDAELREEVEALRRTLRSLSTLQRLAPPSGLPERVERRIQRRSRGRFFRRKPTTRLPFEWFSFVIILALLVLYFLALLETKYVAPAPAIPERPPASQPAPPREGDTVKGETSP